MHFYSCIKVNYIYICTFIGSLLSEDRHMNDITDNGILHRYWCKTELFCFRGSVPKQIREDVISDTQLHLVRHFGFLFLS